jgi:HK97 family phage major capsid protein
MENNINTQCQRLAEVKSQMEAILYDANGKERQYTADEGVKFDSLKSEAKTLKAEIADYKQRVHRLEDYDTLKSYVDEAPRPMAAKRDAVEDLQAHRLEVKRGVRGRMRNFPNTPAGREAAYNSGLLLLASGHNRNKEWAVNRAKERGINQFLAYPQGEDNFIQGGALVFPEFEDTLINLKEIYGVMQKDAYKIPMSSDTLIIPRRAGGTVVYYPGENTQLTESQMNFDQVLLVAKKYAQMTRWSTELGEDSVIALADLLASEFAYQFSKAEDFNAFIGDGTSAYAGVVGLLYKLSNNSVNAVNVNGVSTALSASGHNTPATLTRADFEAVTALLPLYAEPKAKWYMHRSIFWAAIAPIIDAIGGNLATILLSGADKPMRFFGYDIEFCQAMPSTSTYVTTATSPQSIVAVLGDLSVTTYMGERRGVAIRTSDERYIEFDQIAIQATQRVAFNNVVGDSVAPTSVPGPLVGLQLHT